MKSSESPDLAPMDPPPPPPPECRSGYASGAGRCHNTPCRSPFLGLEPVLGLASIVLRRWRPAYSSHLAP